jgi:hypothetical protein
MPRLPVQFRPLVGWPRKVESNRRKDPFSLGVNASVELLCDEIEKLDGKNVVIQIDVLECEIRPDGWPYHNAKPLQPGVIVSFQSRKGPLQFACDKHVNWQANLRAIALTLERLRLAAMYGCTCEEEQYTGFRALPAPEPVGFANVTEAQEWIQTQARRNLLGFRTLETAEDVRAAFRMLSKRLHPDHGGNATDFNKLVAARDMLLEVNYVDAHV